MDLPAANCVIRFDAMQHAVSLVQGRGRARQEQSSFVVLSERAGRSASALADTERQQLDLIRNFKPESLEESQESRIASQKSREIMAKNSLYGLLTKLTAMSRLNVFSQKTKTHLRIRSETNEKGFVTTIHYKSALRNLEVRVYAANKKASKQDAALQMVLKLRQELENTT